MSRITDIHYQLQTEKMSLEASQRLLVEACILQGLDDIAIALLNYVPDTRLEDELAVLEAERAALLATQRIYMKQLNFENLPALLNWLAADEVPRPCDSVPEKEYDEAKIAEINEQFNTAATPTEPPSLSDVGTCGSTAKYNDVDCTDCDDEESMTLLEEVIYDFLQAVPKGDLPSIEQAKVIEILDAVNTNHTVGTQYGVRRGALDPKNVERFVNGEDFAFRGSAHDFVEIRR